MAEVTLTTGQTVETGCYVDGHWGQYGSARAIEVATDLGWDDQEAADLAARHLASMGPSDAEGLGDDDWEALIGQGGAADDAETYLNGITPSGYAWGWFEGEFYLWADHDWASNDPSADPCACPECVAERLSNRSDLGELFAYYRRPQWHPGGKQFEAGPRCDHPYCDGWHGTGRSFPPSLFISPARYAINNARTELALREAEADGRIRFDWEYDSDYVPDGDCGIPEEEARNLDSGKWEVLGCRAYVPRKCPHCGHELGDQWDEVASLWGIVTDVDDRYDYRREVEHELASEAGVID